MIIDAMTKYAIFFYLKYDTHFVGLIHFDHHIFVYLLMNIIYCAFDLVLATCWLVTCCLSDHSLKSCLMVVLRHNLTKRIHLLFDPVFWCSIRSWSTLNRINFFRCDFVFWFPFGCTDSNKSSWTYWIPIASILEPEVLSQTWARRHASLL